MFPIDGNWIPTLDKFQMNSMLGLVNKMLLQVLGALNKMKLLWIPGHCLIDLNQRCDLLVRNGLVSQMFETDLL